MDMSSYVPTHLPVHRFTCKACHAVFYCAQQKVPVKRTHAPTGIMLLAFSVAHLMPCMATAERAVLILTVSGNCGEGGAALQAALECKSPKKGRPVTAYAVALAAALSIESPFMHIDNITVCPPTLHPFPPSPPPASLSSPCYVAAEVTCHTLRAGTVCHTVCTLSVGPVSMVMYPRLPPRGFGIIHREFCTACCTWRGCINCTDIAPCHCLWQWTNSWWS